MKQGVPIKMGIKGIVRKIGVKGIVSVTSCDPACKDAKARFTSVELN